MSIHSEIIGEGDPIVLIHGFCETSSVWRPLTNKLALSYQVITLDLPGFGKSPLPSSSFSIMDIAEMVHGILEDNNLLQSAVIGHSLGGYVALALAERHAEDFKGFGLFHSTSFADDDEKKRSRNKTIDFVKKRGVEVFADSFVQQLFYVKNRSRLETEIRQVTKIAGETSETSLISYMEAMRDRPDRSNVLESLTLPTLFIAGDQDGSVPIEKSRAHYELMQNATIKELKDVAHMGMFEATQECFVAISEFLSNVYPSNNSYDTGMLPDRDLKKNLGCG
ncbi:alpha/beta fold hydrolase [Fulvivirga lutea]|uniref:Alpha/beta hydrolase n=1 Tax=Fulvivirga lutea TaxID=2810512 RepID=A0A975A157_9BACT|nr:alpha/beta hydrolase [Fulvivirga lutea]QSE98094.1 alpha/beta hydrolase [Fulvivirga lutea]